MENTEQQVREWIKGRSKRIKSFYHTAIMKDLNLDYETAISILTRLSTEEVLKPLYHYDCECDYEGIYKEVDDIEKECPWCDSEIGLNDIFIEFEIVR